MQIRPQRVMRRVRSWKGYWGLSGGWWLWPRQVPCFGLDRRGALWQIHGLATRRQPLLPLPSFPSLSGLESIVWDYQASSHSSRGHLLKPLRPVLAAQRLPTARQPSRMPDGRRVRYVGMIICRLRPGTARGVTFMTLEDETGFVNLVIWKQISRCYCLLAKTLSCMGATGKLQVAEGVTHLVVERIWKPRLENGSFRLKSRDFH